jgi:hypothetical protein
MNSELDLLRRLYRETLPQEELIELYYNNRDRYRVLLHLVQQPKFPERFSLNIVPKFFAMDLIRIVKNKRTNPYIRKRTEIEFVNRYQKYPLGEKLSYMRVAPTSLLLYFIEEKDVRVLKTILKNPYCTEDLVVRMINRYTPRHQCYEVLYDTEWYKRPRVAEAIAHDLQAPIRMLTRIIPYLNLRQLEKLYNDEKTHQSVKDNIIRYMRQRGENRENE